MVVVVIGFDKFEMKVDNFGIRGEVEFKGDEVEDSNICVEGDIFDWIDDNNDNGIFFFEIVVSVNKEDDFVNDEYLPSFSINVDLDKLLFIVDVVGVNVIEDNDVDLDILLFFINVEGINDKAVVFILEDDINVFLLYVLLFIIEVEDINVVFIKVVDFLKDVEDIKVVIWVDNTVVFEWGISIISLQIGSTING